MADRQDGSRIVNAEPYVDLKRKSVETPVSEATPQTAKKPRRTRSEVAQVTPGPTSHKWKAGMEVYVKVCGVGWTKGKVHG